MSQVDYLKLFMVICIVIVILGVRILSKSNRKLEEEIKRKEAERVQHPA